MRSERGECSYREIDRETSWFIRNNMVLKAMPSLMHVRMPPTCVTPVQPLFIIAWYFKICSAFEKRLSDHDVC